jgi:uncharacterized protein
MREDNRKDTRFAAPPPPTSRPLFVARLAALETGVINAAGGLAGFIGVLRLKILMGRSAPWIIGAIVWLAAGHTSAQVACPPTASQPTLEQALSVMRTARDRGALWTVDKGAHRSWLYGTIHLGNLEVAMPGPEVRAAFRAAEVIAMELDPANDATAQAVWAPQPPSEATPVPPALVERLKALARKACIPWEPLSNLPPMLIATRLIALEPRWDGFDQGFATEYILSGLALGGGKPVVALETADTQRQALTGGPAAEPLLALEGSISLLEQDRVRPLMRTLVQAWSNGDPATLDNYGRSDAKAYLDGAVFARNQGLAEAVDRLHQQGKRVFAAVGILHMTGDQGLPKRLEKLGYAVARVPFEGAKSDGASR